jgi:hypothetical protein
LVCARYPVADHNVPTLGLMLAFCEYTEQWMHQHQENVISVHCRGGAARWELDTKYWRALRSLSHHTTPCSPPPHAPRQGQIGHDDLRVAALFGPVPDG